MARHLNVAVDDLPLENLALYQLFKSSGLGLEEFAKKKIGVSRQAISALFRKGRNGKYPPVSHLVRTRLAASYGLEPDWLERRADYLEKEKYEAVMDGKIIPGVETKPHYLTLACAGRLGELDEASFKPMPVIKQLPSYDCTIQITGDSMTPTFLPGDIVAVRNVTASDFKQWGHPHVLNTRQGVILKRIFLDEENRGYKCVSDNNEYPPFVVPEDEIYGINMVVGVLRILG